MRGENQAGPLFTIVICVDAWMIALEVDHCVFTSLYSNDCISGCRYPNEMRYNSLDSELITQFDSPCITSNTFASHRSIPHHYHNKIKRRLNVVVALYTYTRRVDLFIDGIILVIFVCMVKRVSYYYAHHLFIN